MFLSERIDSRGLDLFTPEFKTFGFNFKGNDVRVLIPYLASRKYPWSGTSFVYVTIDTAMLKTLRMINEWVAWKFNFQLS